jgi:predicted RNA methylase
MAAATIKIDQKTLGVLASIEWNDDKAILTCGTLSRPEYVKVNAVLEALGGRWNKKAKAHLFDGDAREAVEATIEAGEFVDAKKLFQFFETPDALADEVVKRAEIKNKSDLRILEPSAGTGQLIRALKRAGVTAFTQAIEIHPAHLSKLHGVVTDACTCDFLALTPEAWEPFDYVIMNPPYAGQADIDHVRHACKFVKPGGRLVAIMSPGWTFRTNRKSVEFKAFVDEFNSDIIFNEAGAFKESGTMIRTVTVVLDKP